MMNLVSNQVADNSSDVIRDFITTTPMILCRTNKQVRALEEIGYYNTTTVHQAKGLEYENVIVIDAEIRDKEDLNVGYVALTRARNNLMVANFPSFYTLLKEILKCAIR